MPQPDRLSSRRPALRCALSIVALLAPAAACPMAAFGNPVAVGSAVHEEPLDPALRQLRRLLPDGPEGFSAERAAAIDGLLPEVVADLAALSDDESDSPEQRLVAVRRLAAARRWVDEFVRSVLDRRFELAALPAGDGRTAAIRSFLEIGTGLLDVSSHANAELQLVVQQAIERFTHRPDLLEALVDQVAADECAVAARSLPLLLHGGPPENPDRSPLDATLTRKALDVLSRHGHTSALPDLVRLVKDPGTPPDLAVRAAETVVRIGVPQGLPPRQRARAGGPAPHATAGELREALERLDVSTLAADVLRRRETLASWLDRHERQGVGPDGYAVGGVTFRPGDWLLMRNSSPYNRFTDLRPGLFTHVGIVARHRDPDGVHRMVLVDVTERRPRIRGVNVERTLAEPAYYALLRHEDPEVGHKMGEVASSLVGNPLEFDRSFEIARVEALQGQPLDGRKIHTYCAGLLLLAAQETGLPRSEFFPLAEGPAHERIVENFAELGIRIGDDFISPTGALFARRMRLVHWSDPVYDPGREVEQRIYDHFAARMEQERIAPRPNLFQTLRQELAQASRTNPMLAQALAALAGVHPDTDLAEAVRAAAVVESLDAAAEASRAEFDAAWAALQRSQPSPPVQAAFPGFPGQSSEDGADPDEDDSGLLQTAAPDRTARRLLRQALVDRHVERGRQRIDELFFPAAPHK